MKPWENVKRERQRRKLWLYSAIVIGGFSAIIAVSNVHTAAPVKSTPLDTPASRDAKRVEDIKNLQSALTAYLATHKTLPKTLPNIATQICSVASPECKKTKLVDLNYLITTDTGLTSIPTDPVGGPGYGGNGYTVMLASDGSIVFAAPRAEGGNVIEFRK